MHVRQFLQPISLILLAIASLAWAVTGRSETLIVGIDHSFPPFTYQDDQGAYRGLHVEIISRALEDAGMAYEVRGYPWKRLVLLADLAELDLALPFRHKPERFEKYYMVGPFTETGSRTFFFGLNDTSIKWKVLPDLTGYVIGLIDGFAYPESIEQAVYLDYYRFNGSTQKLALMLRLQRIDLLVSDETVFWDSVERGEMVRAFQPVGAPLDRVMRYVVVPRPKEALASKVQAALDRFKRDDAYRAILERYGVAL
ncbi:substrate-binding periplasmic protein [Aestuariispira insulae]|uniref:Amino acid ABC transporter substrate-binding protein (PAAT family) n=1 Tax=Aestuariispira insulae TaxID=1461337 RepID=A0A3D9H5M5_9PROT|nr:transporter substrate-binding domain-containing protein [Aestuariispira insulae]RED44833.1 amino acid ABC transporter substrate-binding protein (PAAT family) [Aestuariispira insulae]